MRKILLDGYVEDYAFFDENGNSSDIAPERISRLLYGEAGDQTDDVEIMINSYGGSCNAAARLYDLIAAYPGHVTVTISGTVASAATSFIQGADRVQMTPGSLFMIHDPMTLAFGNATEMKGVIRMLDACKESIINMYRNRCPMSREAIGALMTKETWMDATEALERGFVDNIVNSGAQNRSVSLSEARACVNAWYEKHGKTQDTSPLPAAAPLAPDGAAGVDQSVTEENPVNDETETAPAEGEPVAEAPVEAQATDEAAENELTEPADESAESKVPAENEADEENMTAEDPELDQLRDETAKWAADMLARMV